jgi:hypothetical protein
VRAQLEALGMKSSPEIAAARQITRRALHSLAGATESRNSEGDTPSCGH